VNQTDSPAERHLERAKVLRELGRHAEALGELGRVLAVDPQHAYAHRLTADTLYHLGRYRDAEQSARRALAITPDSAAAHAELGWALRGQRRPFAARQAAQRAVALDPDSAGVWYLLSVTELRVGFGRKRARRAADQMIRLAPEWPTGLNWLSVLAQDAGRWADVEDLSLRVLRVEPEHAAALYRLGVVRRRQRRHQEATELFERAARLDGGGTPARRDLYDLVGRPLAQIVAIAGISLCFGGLFLAARQPVAAAVVAVVALIGLVIPVRGLRRRLAVASPAVQAYQRRELRHRVAWYGRPLVATATAAAALAALIHVSPAGGPDEPVVRALAVPVVLSLIGSLVWTLLRFTGFSPARILPSLREPWRRFRDLTDTAPRQRRISVRRKTSAR
jgi:tetratricopeptide (TPR) repeat protein